PLGGCRPCFPRGLVGHAVQPVGDHLPWCDKRCLANKDQEGGLECVFGVVVVAQDSAAHAPDHRAVTFDQGSEGSFLPMLEVAPKELPIGQSCSLPHKHRLAKMLEDTADLAGRHQVSRWLA